MVSIMLLEHAAEQPKMVSEEINASYGHEWIYL